MIGDLLRTVGELPGSHDTSPMLLGPIMWNALSVSLFVHKTFSFTQELKDVPNGDLKADVIPAKEVAADDHAKSD